MKKHWLHTLVVFGLGVVTVPGVLGGVRWWQNSEKLGRPKFVQLRAVEDPFAATDEAPKVIHVDGFTEAMAKVAEIERRRQRSANLIANEADEVDSTAPALAAKPVRVNFNSELEPPVLAQNSPGRKTTFSQPDRFTDTPVLNDFGDGPIPVKQRSATANSKPEQPDGIESLAEPNLSDEQKAKLTTLREKLAELTKAKAELVNEQTLEETIFSLEKQISNLHAAQKLLSAQQILRALAEEFPDSPAAAKAQRMLEAAESKKLLKPSPDPLSALPTYR